MPAIPTAPASRTPARDRSRAPSPSAVVTGITRWIAAPALPLAGLYLARFAGPVGPLDPRLVGLLGLTLAAAVFGLGPGLLSAGETVLAVGYLSGLPLTSALVADPRSAVPFGMFALTAIVVAIAAGAWRNARHAVATRRAQLARVERELADARREAERGAVEVVALREAAAASDARLRIARNTDEAAVQARTALLDTLPVELRESQSAVPEAIALFPPALIPSPGLEAPQHAGVQQLSPASSATDPAD
jgi:hypothetical protein